MTANHALGALIERVKAANSWSDTEVSNRAKSRGHTISKSNVARIRNEPVTSLVAKHLFALSAGLGIPVEQVAFAALESMGIPTHSVSSSDAEQAIRVDPGIPEHVRRTLLTIIRNEREHEAHGGQQHGSADQDEPEPGTEAGRTQHSGAGRAPRQGPMNKPTPLRQQDQGDEVDAKPGVAGPPAPPEYLADAARSGLSEAARRRAVELEPEDFPDPEGPEGGA